MNIFRTTCLRFAAVVGLMLASPFAFAALVTYNFNISGTVYVGDETFANAYNLTAGETITATGFFTADLGTSGNETGTVLFATGSGNSMTIDVNGTLLTASDDTGYGTGIGPYLTFTSGTLTDFDFQKTSAPAFNSSFVYFDDFGDLFGAWDSLTLTAVPVPAAVWLFGSGLLGLVGVTRRKTAI